jgi:hypothetical protein
MAVRIRRVAVSRDQRCPLCRGDVAGAPADELAVCAGCEAVHHEACAAELGDGACSTLGCGRRLDAALVPEADEVEGGERSLVLHELRAFAVDVALLFVTGAVLFSLVLLGVIGVAGFRWPLWTMPVMFVGPLVLYGVWSGLQALRARAPRRKRPRK